MGFLRWLLETRPFASPSEGAGWTDELTRMTVATNAIIAVLAVLIAAALVFLLRARNIGRNHLILLVCKVVFLCTLGLTHLVRACSFGWPAYRFQVATNILVALALWAMVVALLDFAVRIRRPQEEREIDHLWGNLEGLAARLRVRELEILKVLAQMESLTPLLPPLALAALQEERAARERERAKDTEVRADERTSDRESRAEERTNDRQSRAEERERDAERP